MVEAEDESWSQGLREQVRVGAKDTQKSKLTKRWREQARVGAKDTQKSKHTNRVYLSLRLLRFLQQLESVVGGVAVPLHVSAKQHTKKTRHKTHKHTRKRTRTCLE
jgi:hypothetical protein